MGLTDRLLADAVLLLHGLFILFAVLGVLLVWRWPRLAWLHLPAVAWAAWVAVTARICPLTPLENSLRVSAGQAGYGGGFIDHYLLGAIYPEGLTRPIQLAMGIGVALLNAIVYALLIARRARAASASLASEPSADE